MWPPRRMRHLLRRASSCLRFSRRRRDASATGEAMRTRACGRTWCSRDVLGSHSPSSVCAEWGPDHTASKALAALGSSHPFLEPGWTLGVRESQAGARNLHWETCPPCPRVVGSACSRASASSLPPMQRTPAQHWPTLGSYLPAPIRLRLDCACASGSRVLPPRARGRLGPTARRRHCFSFKKKPSPLASEAAASEASGLRLRAVIPAQNLPGIVVISGLV